MRLSTVYDRLHYSFITPELAMTYEQTQHACLPKGSTSLLNVHWIIVTLKVIMNPYLMNP